MNKFGERNQSIFFVTTFVGTWRRFVGLQAVHGICFFLFGSSGLCVFLFTISCGCAS